MDNGFIKILNPEDLKKHIMTNVFLEKPLYIAEVETDRGLQPFVIFNKKVFWMTDFMALVCLFSEGQEFLKVFDEKAKKAQNKNILKHMSNLINREHHTQTEVYEEHPFVDIFNKMADKIKYVWIQIGEDQGKVDKKEFYTQLFKSFKTIEIPKEYILYCNSNFWLAIIKYLEIECLESIQTD